VVYLEDKWVSMINNEEVDGYMDGGRERYLYMEI
tara:strand:+ start:539 stop:640 length:102 start_codon:yes stop_codon:yes gene_type:complete